MKVGLLLLLFYYITTTITKSCFLICKNVLLYDPVCKIYSTHDSDLIKLHMECLHTI